MFVFNGSIRLYDYPLQFVLDDEQGFGQTLPPTPSPYTDIHPSETLITPGIQVSQTRSIQQEHPQVTEKSLTEYWLTAIVFYLLNESSQKHLYPKQHTDEMLCTLTDNWQWFNSLFLQQEGLRTIAHANISERLNEQKYFTLIESSLHDDTKYDLAYSALYYMLYYSDMHNASTYLNIFLFQRIFGIDYYNIINQGSDGIIAKTTPAQCIKLYYPWVNPNNEQRIYDLLKDEFPYEYREIVCTDNKITMPLGSDLDKTLRANTKTDYRYKLARDLVHCLTQLKPLHIVHCDIKPTNIVITGGKMRLIDFTRSQIEPHSNYYIIYREQGLNLCTHKFNIFHCDETKEYCSTYDLDMFATLLTLFHPDTDLQSILSQQQMGILIQRIDQEAYHEFTAPYSIHEITNCYTRLIGIENLLALMQTALSSEPDPSVRNYFSDEGRDDVIQPPKNPHPDPKKNISDELDYFPEEECNDVTQTTKKLERDYPAFEKFGDDEKNKVAKQILSLGQQTNTSCTSRMFGCWLEASSEIKQQKLYAIINSLSYLELHGYEDSIDYKKIGLFSARETETRQVINIVARHQIMEKNSNHTTSTIQ